MAGFVMGNISGEYFLPPLARKYPGRGLQLAWSGFRVRPCSFIRETFYGFIWHRTPARHTPYLHYLGVDGSRRKQGIGRELMDRFAQDLRDRKMERFELSVEEGNTPAIRFYERLGGHRKDWSRRADGYYYRFDFDVNVLLKK